MHFARHAAVVLAITAAGLVISLQGWKSRRPGEELDAIHQAVAIVAHGTIPDRGSLTDFGSHYPPGSAWLIVPGVWLTADVRLVELIGGALLYAGAIAAVFAIGRTMFGFGPAVLAATIYAVSEIALVFSTTLWPRGHPTFYIWMVYLAVRWVTRRDGRAAAAACLVWAAGMYVYMELAPAILALPALWLLYRPPIDWKMMAASAAVAIVMWQPFLAFQWGKDFVDVRSQLLRQHVPSQDGPAPPPPPPPLAFEWREQLLSGGLRGVTDHLTGNLRTRVLAGDVVLLGLLLGGMAMVAVGRPPSDGIRPAPAAPRRAGAATVVAIAVFAATVIVNESLLRWVTSPDSDLAAGSLNVRRLHVWLVVGISTLAVRRATARSALAALPNHWRTDGMPVLIALAVPWIALLLVVEADRHERLYSVWPLQALLIAAFADAWARRPGARPVLRWVLPVVVVLVVGANDYTLHKVRDWAEHGWAGIGPSFMPIPADRPPP